MVGDSQLLALYQLLVERRILSVLPTLNGPAFHNLALAYERDIALTLKTYGVFFFYHFRGSLLPVARSSHLAAATRNARRLPVHHSSLPAHYLEKCSFQGILLSCLPITK